MEKSVLLMNFLNLYITLFNFHWIIHEIHNRFNIYIILIDS